MCSVGGGLVCFAREASSPLSPLAGERGGFPAIRSSPRRPAAPRRVAARGDCCVSPSETPKPKWPTCNVRFKRWLRTSATGQQETLSSRTTSCHDTPVGIGPSPEFAVKLFEEHLEGHAGGSPHERLGVVEKDPRLGGTGMDQ